MRARRSWLARERITWVALALGFLCGVTDLYRWGEPRAGGEGPPAVSSPPPFAAPVPAPAALLARLPSGEDARLRASERGAGVDPGAPDRLVEWLDPPAERPELEGPLRIEYTLDAELGRRVQRVFERGRVKRGHAIVMDPRNGRLLAFASSDPEGFAPTDAYPAASLVKVVTAAAALEEVPEAARTPCRYRGNRYRLRSSHLKPVSSGREASLERAIASSNNQCFAKLAVNALGVNRLLDWLDRFGWTRAPAPGHASGEVDPGETAFEIGKLGCGLDGCRITPLHAAQLAGILTTGLRTEPWWIDRIVDAHDRALTLPERPEPVRVLRPELAAELRAMMVRTTTRGTARSAFRDRRGRPRLGSIQVAGKTGNLTGSEPRGRYEWFVGLAPAEAPRIAVAVVQVQDNLWWARSSQLAADILVDVFCERGRCLPEHANRFTGDLGERVAPVFLAESGIR